MTLAINSSKSYQRADNGSLPVFTISGHGTYPAIFIRDFFYLPISVDSYSWQPPNQTGELKVFVRDLELSTWELSAGIANDSNDFTKSGADGFSGAFAEEVADGSCSIEGIPADIDSTVVFSLQNGDLSHDYLSEDVEHALVFEAGGFGSIREKGIIGRIIPESETIETARFSWQEGDRGLVEYVGGIVRYYLVKPDGRLRLLRSKRSSLEYPIIPAVTLIQTGAGINYVRVWTGADAWIDLYLVGALRDFQDWENQAAWESLAEKTMNKDKSEDFTFFSEERNVMTLSLNIRWDDEDKYLKFLKFWKYHDISKEFIFVDAARKKEFFAKFISSFKDSPMGAGIFGMSVDIRQMINPPVFYDIYVQPDLTPPTVSITLPITGATVDGVITLQASAADNIHVNRVEWYRFDGVGFAYLGNRTVAPYEITFDTMPLDNGDLVISATAFDTWGNHSEAAFLTVHILNVPDPYPPGETIIYSITGTSTDKALIKLIVPSDEEAFGAEGDDDYLI